MTTLLRHLLWTAAGINVLAAENLPADPEIVDRFVQASRMQRSALQNEPVQLEITASLLNSQRHSQLRALRYVTDNGEIAYDVLETSGDDGIRRQVIARYLAAESQSRDADATALTPVNYKFRLKAIVDRLGRRVHVFKGELWVDEATGLPVHEAGQLVKAPHPLLRRLTFTRDYEIRGGRAVPTQDQITIDVRFWGRAALSIGFTTN